MMRAPQLDELLRRHHDFWRRAPGSGPLVGRMPTRVWKERPFPLSDGRILHDPARIHPEDIDVDRMVGADRERADLFLGDMVRPLLYPLPQAWMGALIGCPIHASAFGCVAKPTGVDLEDAARAFSVDDALNSDWAPVMDRMLDRAAEVAAGERAVRQLHLRGIIDMFAAYFGEDRLCMAVYDAPDAIAALGDRFVEVHIATAARGRARRPLWHGGAVSLWFIHAPGPNLDYQVDASSLFSAEVYEKHFLQFDRKILATAPYNLTHLHSCGLHILDALLKLDEARAFEINLDRETGAWDKDRILYWCKRIQDAGKALLIWGELAEDEFAEFREALSPDGLAFTYWNP